MSEIQVDLSGWDSKRNLITDMTLYAEDGDHKVEGSQPLPADAKHARLALPDGRFSLYVLFTAAPYIYYAGLDEAVVPAAAPYTIDLDKATVDDVVTPMP